MLVLKFGGSSLGTVHRIQQVAEIIQTTARDNPELAVVVSAFGGVTNQLIQTAQQAAEGNDAYQETLKWIEEKHLQTVRELLPARSQTQTSMFIMQELTNLRNVLHGLYLVKELSARTLDYVMSFGERFSAYIVAQLLQHQGLPAFYLDARRVIRTDNSFGGARVNYAITNKNIQAFFAQQEGIAVITGFIASTENHQTTTLGRSGSDFTASIFGAALHASEIQIWTDVDGVLTADPRMVPEAFTIPELSYEEAMELSHFGATVVHPRTMQPALETHIPIRIKNTFNPQHPGTVICRQPAPSAYAIKGISSIPRIGLINVSGTGMIGATGIAGKIFTALAGQEINIILISQASSEHSICFGVLPEDAPKAQQVLKKALRLELLEKTVGDIQVETDLAVVAVVGENMRHTAGIAGKVFSALGSANINIVAIAQGSSELNISLVVHQRDLQSALQTIHGAFFSHREVRHAHNKF